MVHSYFRGIEYYVVLKKKYDYFDIVPDIEKAMRKRVVLHDGNPETLWWKEGYGDLLKIVAMPDSDDRLAKSDYYLQQKDTFYQDITDDKVGVGRRIITPPIDVELTDEEKQFRDYIVKTYEVAYEGWFDVVEYH